MIHRCKLLTRRATIVLLTSLAVQILVVMRLIKCSSCLSISAFFAQYITMGTAHGPAPATDSTVKRYVPGARARACVTAVTSALARDSGALFRPRARHQLRPPTQGIVVDQADAHFSLLPPPLPGLLLFFSTTKNPPVEPALDAQTSPPPPDQQPLVDEHRDTTDSTGPPDCHDLIATFATGATSQTRSRRGGPRTL